MSLTESFHLLLQFHQSVIPARLGDVLRDDGDKARLLGLSAFTLFMRVRQRT